MALFILSARQFVRHSRRLIQETKAEAERAHELIAQSQELLRQTRPDPFDVTSRQAAKGEGKRRGLIHH